MTPKEKANRLRVQIYAYYQDKITWEQAKRYALIAVEELLEQCNDYRDIDLGKSYDYWDEVKQELHYL